jgi:hypothetical protein
VYPHTNKSKLNFLVPDNLKDADMLMFEIFKSLGLNVRFRPVVSNLRNILGDEGHPLPLVGLDLEWQVWDMLDDYAMQEFDDWAGRNEKPTTNRWWLSETPEGEEEEEKEGRYVDFHDVHWLNDWGHRSHRLPGSR